MKILIVEDDSISRTLLRHIVASQPDHEVIEASSGMAAWDLLREEPSPDLCLLDIHMPGMNGLELLKRIRGDERLKTLKVIFCTSVNERATVAQAIALSVNYYILKPYVKHLILEQIKKVARQLGPRMRSESLGKACDRLGINMATYLAMRKSFAGEIVKMVQAAKKSLKTGDRESIAPRLRQLKGASLNLGIRSVFSLICRTETALDALGVHVTDQDLAAISGNRGRNSDASSEMHVRQVVKRLAELDEEAQRMLKASS
jgi:two-component system, chemotaxis family, chemotaxis protein CheY